MATLTSIKSSITKLDSNKALVLVEKIRVERSITKIPAKREKVKVSSARKKAEKIISKLTPEQARRVLAALGKG